MFLLFAASFASWSASSFLWSPACALIQLNSTFHCISISTTLVLIWFMRCVWFFWCGDCIIRLNTVFSIIFKFCMYSYAFRIAICSAWLLEQRPFSLIQISYQESTIRKAPPATAYPFSSITATHQFGIPTHKSDQMNQDTTLTISHISVWHQTT
jgi:hypothetical protein